MTGDRLGGGLWFESLHREPCSEPLAFYCTVVEENTQLTGSQFVNSEAPTLESPNLYDSKTNDIIGDSEAGFSIDRRNVCCNLSGARSARVVPL